MARALIECACCGVEGTLQGHGYIGACYYRWRNAGWPASGPPPAPLRGEELREEYTFLRDNGVPHTTACGQLGLSLKGGLHRKLMNAYEGREPRKPNPPKKAAYLRLRLEGHSRHQAAAILGAALCSTYQWERGTMKTRPRKAAA